MVEVAYIKYKVAEGLLLCKAKMFHELGECVRRYEMKGDCAEEGLRDWGVLENTEKRTERVSIPFISI